MKIGIIGAGNVGCDYRKLRPDTRTSFDQLVQTDGRVLTDPP
jgi:hypothetical protein